MSQRLPPKVATTRTHPSAHPSLHSFNNRAFVPGCQEQLPPDRALHTQLSPRQAQTPGLGQVHRLSPEPGCSGGWRQGGRQGLLQSPRTHLTQRWKLRPDKVGSRLRGKGCREAEGPGVLSKPQGKEALGL